MINRKQSIKIKMELKRQILKIVLEIHKINKKMKIKNKIISWMKMMKRIWQTYFLGRMIKMKIQFLVLKMMKNLKGLGFLKEQEVLFDFI